MSRNVHLVHGLHRIVIETPVGHMVGVASDCGVAFLEFENRDRMSRMSRRLARWFRGCEVHSGWHPHTRSTRRWLEAYFDGERASAPPLDLRGTVFERAVWSRVRAVPAGATATYGQIAAAIGRPLAARAVGAANGANPVTLLVPCHRLLGSAGSLTGYGGGLDVKRWLLAHEKSCRGGKGSDAAIKRGRS